MQQRTDEELMLDVKSGQLHLLGRLFERHHVKLFNFFLKFCGNRHWSEDMVQNTFYKILKYAASYDDRGVFQAWMFNIARNVASDFLQTETCLARDTEHDMDSFTSSATDPAYLQELKHEERRLQLALLQLSVEKRQLILLSKINQISLTDLADMYECSVSAIKVRVHRALELLRDYYDQESVIAIQNASEKLV